MAQQATAAFQRAASLGAIPAVHYGTAFARQGRYREAPRHGTPVHTAAAIGKHPWGRQDAGNVAHTSSSNQLRADARR